MIPPYFPYLIRQDKRTLGGRNLLLYLDVKTKCFLPNFLI